MARVKPPQFNTFESDGKPAYERRTGGRRFPAAPPRSSAYRSPLPSTDCVNRLPESPQSKLSPHRTLSPHNRL